MISHRLDIALQETIQQHADQHKHGAQDMRYIMAILALLAGGYLAQLPKGKDRQEWLTRFCHATKRATEAQIRKQIVTS